MIGSAIQMLVKESYVILQIRINKEPAGDMFLLSHKFLTATSNSVESIEYCECDGIDITSFLTRNSINPDRSNFLSNLNQIVNESPVIHIQFQKDIFWIKWSSSSK